MKNIQPCDNPKDMMMFTEDSCNGMAIFNPHVYIHTVTRNVDESFKDFTERIVLSLKHSLITFKNQEHTLRGR